MDTQYLVLLLVVLVGGIGYYFYNREKPVKEAKAMDQSSVPLQLQAYERMILLVDRIALPNLINRNNQELISAKEMQRLLSRNIRDEFDYNITQQIYITPETWKAVRNLKEKNLLIIHQMASGLPENASSYELNRAILDFLMQDPASQLPELVCEALSFEAKKLL
ncbi:MAG: hypothetical protein KGO92_11295 [Bacteroidota bacterium]|nr:hypothetical protein [Bacteroidota bacterium]